MRPYQYPEDINGLAGAVAVSTLTVLKAFTSLGHLYHTLLFVIQNTDATNPVDMVVETSEDGTRPDGQIKWTVTAAAGKQASVEIGPGLIRRYWRVSAVSAGPTVNVTWAVKGAHRS